MAPKSFGVDFGEVLGIRAFADAQATVDLSHRTGLSKARHIETLELWIQDALGMRAFELCKPGGGRNPADAFTKPVPHETMERHLAAVGYHAVPSVTHPKGVASGGGMGTFAHVHSTAAVFKYTSSFA